ncbi:GumK N-terminal domain-containing glycosyltransferase [Ancylobacter radicis]|uniref:Glucuronosyltransferase GumK N-terminal domain-containing protein n=1 Tax=Ancylobacter radicis TaxID=2836179 RepID=A0ABS5R4F2_9HYPH|nr:hypothetical protein [Ancylobacter radicis]MBS9476102.1 hypothetical protein [Ancylobacter radicis]
MPKLTIVSTHVYSGLGRKASIHFLADAYARRGYAVSFVSVGRGPLHRVRNKAYRTIRATVGVNQWRSYGGVSAILTEQALEIINLRKKPLNELWGRIIQMSGCRIAAPARQAVIDADILIIDSGVSLLFADAVRALNPHAPLVFNAADIMACIGAHPLLTQLEQRLALNADVTRIPSPLMQSLLPAGARCLVAPHGLDKSVFDACRQSPYKDGTINIVSVGNTLHDAASFDLFAGALEGNVILHCFGGSVSAVTSPNVIYYGERPFAEIIPYLKFADAGLAAYRVSASTAYMADSSLKMIQYRYCGLPAFVPNTIRWSYEGVITYTPGDRESIGRALMLLLHEKRGRKIEGAPVLSWDDVAGMILAELDRSAGRRLSA